MAYFYDLYHDSENRLWISGSKEFSILPPGSSKIELKEHALSYEHVVEGDSGSYWFSFQGRVYQRSWPGLEPLTYFKDLSQIRRIHTLAYGKGQLYMGCMNGLWVLSDSVPQRHLAHRKELETRINDLQILQDNSLIIASLGQGLMRLNPKGELQQVKKSDGLLTDLLNCSITLPGDSITWVGSSLGLSKVVWANKYGAKPRIENFTVYNGLINNEILDIEYFEGKLWLATGKGISIMNPDKFHPSSTPPLLHSLKIEVNQEQVINSTSSIQHDDLIRIHFKAISMSSRGNIKYRYRLQGLDDKWETTKNRFVEFKSLPPGDYQLTVEAINAAGTLSLERLNYAFQVLPPFWATWWFRGLAILFLMAGPGIYFRLLYRNQQRESQLKAQSLESEQEALSSQITPHFLFNALNSIQNLIQHQQSKQAVLQLSNFAWLMRRILHNVKRPAISLSDELETLRLYLDLEVLRFRDSFTYSINTDESINSDIQFVPPMLIQPFIENSIWHGITNKPDRKGHVDLNFFQKDDMLIVQVLDDGVGRAESQRLKPQQPPEKQSTGIRAVRRRIEILNQGQASAITLNIEDRSDEAGKVIGTEVILGIPIDYS